MEKEKKGSKLGLILLVIILAFGFGILGSYVGNRLFNEKDKEEKKEILVDGETEIKAQGVINALDRNIEILEEFNIATMSYNENIYLEKTGTGDEYEKSSYDFITKRDKIDSDTARHYVLLYMVENQLNERNDGTDFVTEYKDKLTAFDPEMGENIIDSQEIPGVIQVSSLEEEYSTIFKGTVTHGDSLSGCPAFKYDKINNLYWEMGACGGTTNLGQYGYTYKYTEDDDYVYVYRSIAFSETVESGDKYNLKLYKDFYKTEYKTITDEDTFFYLDGTNYEEFTKFVYTFKKDGDNYIFVSLEKI